MRQHRLHRPGFTLIEILVVIGILAFLATLTALYFPSFQDREMTNRGADQLSQWLLIARQQAKRDGRATGIRLTLNGQVVTTLTYIQQPDAFAPGSYTGFTPAVAPNGPTAKFSLPQGMNFTQSPLSILPGDYLEVINVKKGLPLSHRITSVAASTLTLDPNTWVAALPPGPTNLIYRIIQQPQPIFGEQPLTMPGTVAISFEQPTGSSLSLNVPSRNGNLEVLFGPSGAVIGQGTGSGQIVFWIRDTSKPFGSSVDLLASNPRLVIVQPRTGAVINQPVAAGADPYVFTRDGTSSGL